MKKIIVSFVFALAVFAPLGASAATIAELQAKLTALLLQVDQVRVELITAQTAVATSASITTSVGKICLKLANNFSLGASDALTGREVTFLQKALASDASLYPEASITGYFGPATARAVGRLQIRAGIIKGVETQGYGAVGPATRAFLASQCSNSAPSIFPIPAGTIRPVSVTESLESKLHSVTLDILDVSVSKTPTITGSAKNTETVSVTLRSSEVVFKSDVVPVQNGKWSVTTSLLANGTYQIVASSLGGGSVAVGFVVVEAPDTAAPASTAPLVVTPPKVFPPASVVLRSNGSENGASVFRGVRAQIGWSALNVTSCAIASKPDAELSGSVLPQEAGKGSAPLLATTVFTITCVGANGSFVSDSLTVTVLPK